MRLPQPVESLNTDRWHKITIRNGEDRHLRGRFITIRDDGNGDSTLRAELDSGYELEWSTRVVAGWAIQAAA